MLPSAPMLKSLSRQVGWGSQAGGVERDDMVTSDPVGTRRWDCVCISTALQAESCCPPITSLSWPLVCVSEPSGATLCSLVGTWEQAGTLVSTAPGHEPASLFRPLASGQILCSL